MRYALARSLLSASIDVSASCPDPQRYEVFLDKVNHMLAPPEPVPLKLRYILLARFPPARILVGADAVAIAPLCFLLPDRVWDFLKLKTF